MTLHVYVAHVFDVYLIVEASPRLEAKLYSATGLVVRTLLYYFWPPLSLAYNSHYFFLLLTFGNKRSKKNEKRKKMIKGC